MIVSFQHSDSGPDDRLFIIIQSNTGCHVLRSRGLNIFLDFLFCQPAGGDVLGVVAFLLELGDVAGAAVDLHVTAGMEGAA